MPEVFRGKVGTDADSSFENNDSQSRAGAPSSASHSEPYTGSFRNAPEQTAHGWQAIRLGEHPDNDPLPSSPIPAPSAEPAQHAPFHVALLSDRVMAALVDATLVGSAFLLFVLIFAACTPHLPLNEAGLAGAALVLASMFVFYHWLFMSYSTATPGMRYARIALCTFEDENPTRTTMRNRVLAATLAALPLGLGFVWALFDEDSLCWHDRMTRSYQRSYR